MWPDLKFPPINLWNLPRTNIMCCKDCGENMEGGENSWFPWHCPNALEEDWWYAEQDAGPFYCGYDEEEED